MADEFLIPAAETDTALDLTVTPYGASIQPTPWLVARSTGVYTALPHWVDVEVTNVRSAIGSCAISYPAIGDNFGELAKMFVEDHDLDFEVWLQGSRSGPKWRGFLTDCDGDDIDEDSVFRFSGYSLEMLLDEPLNLVTTDGLDRQFINISAGNMLGTLFGEAQASGHLAGMAVDFTPYVDSDGGAWSPATFDLTIKFGDSLTTVLDRLINLGAIDGFRVRPDRVFQVWSAGGAPRQGVDRSDISTGVVLRRGSHMRSAQRRYSSRQACTDASVIYGVNADATITRTDSAARARRGRPIGSVALSMPGVHTAPTAGMYATYYARALAVGALELTITMVVLPGQPCPMIDYDVADFLLSQTRLALYERLRVRQTTLKVDRDSGAVQAVVGLASAAYDHAALVAKVIQETASALKRGTNA